MSDTGATEAYEVRRRAIRQSDLATFSLCPRSVLFGIEDGRRAPSSLAAAGTVLHRFFHRCIDYMREHEEDLMPVDVGLELLLPTMSQVDVPDGDVVALSFKDMDHIRRCATNWLTGLSKEIIPSQIVDPIEHRLFATVECIGPGGEVYEQTISGQLDVLMAWGRGRARIGDWKTGPARPVQPKEAEYVDGKPDGSHLDAFEWAQAEIYTFLVWSKYPRIRWIEFREWSVFWGEARHRIFDRETEYERIRDRIACQAAALNVALDRRDSPARWPAMAGQRQCGFCPGVLRCETAQTEGVITTEKEAMTAYNAWFISAEQRKANAKRLKAYCNTHGPLDLPGGRMLGYDSSDGRKNFGVFKPPIEPEPAPEPLEESQPKPWEGDDVPF